MNFKRNIQIIYYKFALNILIWEISPGLLEEQEQQKLRAKNIFLCSSPV